MIVPMLNGVPWWFVEAMPLRSVDPDGRIAAPSRSNRSSAASSTPRAAGPPEPCVVKHADKLILGEPGGETSERLARLFALVRRRRSAARPDRQRAPRDLVQIVGQCDDQPAVGADPRDLRQASSPTRVPGLDARGMAELAAVGAAIGCPISESGEDRMAVTARLGAFKTRCCRTSRRAGRSSSRRCLARRGKSRARRGIATPALDRLYGVTQLMAESLGC